MIYYDITLILPTKKRIKKTKTNHMVEQIVNRKGSKFDEMSRSYPILDNYYIFNV